MLKNASHIVLPSLLLASLFFAVSSSFGLGSSRINHFSAVATTPANQDIPDDPDQDNTFDNQDEADEDDIMIFEKWSNLRLPNIQNLTDSQRTLFFREYHREISTPPPKV